MGPAELNKIPQLFQPLTDDSAPLWARPLLECVTAEADDPASRYAALASTDNNGRPHARYVVVRGVMGTFENDFIPAGDLARNDIWFITDTRSQKATEFKSSKHAELCWYFRRSRVQFRFSGITRVYAGRDCPVRSRAWSLISEAARVQFYWPEPKTIRDPFHEFEFTVSEPGRTPPDTFMVIQLGIEEVDQLNLTGNPQNRFIYRTMENGASGIIEVNP